MASDTPLLCHGWNTSTNGYTIGVPLPFNFRPPGWHSDVLFQGNFNCDIIIIFIVIIYTFRSIYSGSIYLYHPGHYDWAFCSQAFINSLFT